MMTRLFSARWSRPAATSCYIRGKEPVAVHGFFNLSTWLTAIVGATVLLLVVHLLTARGSTGGRR